MYVLEQRVVVTVQSHAQLGLCWGKHFVSLITLYVVAVCTFLPAAPPTSTTTTFLHRSQPASALCYPAAAHGGPAAEGRLGGASPSGGLCCPQPDEAL